MHELHTPSSLSFVNECQSVLQEIPVFYKSELKIAGWCTKAYLCYGEDGVGDERIF
jgi:hypothetical protein